MREFTNFLLELKNKRELDFEASKPLSSVSTIGVGGEADFFVLPSTSKAFISVVRKAKELKVPFVTVGNSSNIIYSDNGFQGVIICTKRLNNITLCETEIGAKISAEAGVMLPMLSEYALNNSLCGFEGLCSIPGTVGGAVISNAGAYGQEISDFIYGMFILDTKGRLVFRRIAKEMFSYRRCNALKQGEFIISVLFSLEKCEKRFILHKMEEFRKKRKKAQPIGVKSVGSFFKKPDIDKKSPYFGMSAGELIDKTGLKGLSFGGASVSEKHANFIINRKNASCEDIISLAGEIKKRVYESTGVTLYEEPFFVN